MEIKKYLIISLFLILGGLFVTGGQVVVKDGELNVTEDFFVDSDVLYVNSANNQVGIGTTNPGSAKLNVTGTIDAWQITVNGTAIGSSSEGSSAGLIPIGVNGRDTLANLFSPDYVGATRYKARTNATINFIGATVWTVTAGNKFMMAIYDGSDTYPGTQLGVTEEHTFVDGDKDSELLLALNSPVDVVKGETYWIAYISESADLYIFHPHSTANDYSGWYKSWTYNGSMPAEFPAGGTNYHPKNIFGMV